ncbi:ATP-grasp domain-containing protein [bacterium]|nr:ATP-grasp domain-containing protein [bacterium]
MEVVILYDESRALMDSDEKEAHLGVWESIRAVEISLRRLGYRVRRVSLGSGINAVFKQLQNSRPKAVFHLAETAFGETNGESRMAALLDLLGIPHTSSSAESLSLCRDKLAANAVLREHGILTPPMAVSVDGRLPKTLPPKPWITKPSQEDGSIGIFADSVTAAPRKLRSDVKNLYRKFRQPILIESFIAGREFNVGVVGREVLPVSEIYFSGMPRGRPNILGYESKWKYDSPEFKGSQTRCPAAAPAGLKERLNRVGLSALAALNVEGYARVDFRVGARNRIYVLEVNPNPDLSPVGGLSKMAAAAGWGYDGLVSRILAWARKERRPPIR